MNRGPRGMKSGVKNPGKLFLRLMKYVFQKYGLHYVAVIVLILTGVLCNVQGTLFMKNLIDDYITPFLLTENPNFTPLLHAIFRVAGFYAVGILASYGHNRIMINVTQGTLRDLRDDLFSHMEKLPVKYFDTHAHGDIMSVYTNDIDTLTDDQPEYSTACEQRIYHHQRIYQHVGLKCAADRGYASDGGGYGILFEKICRHERKIFFGAAEKSGRGKWLY